MQDLAQASDALAEAGFVLLRWADLPQHGPAPATDDADPDDPDVPYRGWQRSASRILDDRAFAEHRRAVGPAELALLDSQSGPPLSPHTHVLVRDLNLQAQRHDERRIEVIANGLPLWGGSQLAVDNTLVSRLTSAGVQRLRGSTTRGSDGL